MKYFFGLDIEIELVTSWWNGLSEEKQRDILIKGGYTYPYIKGDMHSENIPDEHRVKMAGIVWKFYKDNVEDDKGIRF